MFDHVGFLVRDSAISLPFFTACLAPLGIARAQANCVAFVLDPDSNNIEATWPTSI